MGTKPPDPPRLLAPPVVNAAPPVATPPVPLDLPPLPPLFPVLPPELGVVAPDPPLAPGAEDGSEHAIRLPGASLGPERLRGEGYPSFRALQAEHQID